MWEPWVQSLDLEDPLEKGKVTHSSILAWRIPWTVYSMGHRELDTAEQLSFSIIKDKLLGEKTEAYLLYASLVAQLVKNPPAVWETWVRSLRWEDPLEKGKVTHSSILAWKIPWTTQFMGSHGVGHD